MTKPLHERIPFFDLASWCVDNRVTPRDAELALRRAIMAEALALTRGNKSAAARICGMHRNSFGRFK